MEVGSAFRINSSIVPPSIELRFIHISGVFKERKNTESETGNTNLNHTVCHICFRISGRILVHPLTSVNDHFFLGIPECGSFKFGWSHIIGKFHVWDPMLKERSSVAFDGWSYIPGKYYSMSKNLEA